MKEERRRNDKREIFKFLFGKVFTVVIVNIRVVIVDSLQGKPFLNMYTVQGSTPHVGQQPFLITRDTIPQRY